ncbi:hypothetical protein [Pseudoduganella sp. R-43]|uniref:hypothetical protein n=1 Tax=unclassified Pseudoduganella TaxID=2637179 RepID=UPI003CEA4D68
MKLAMIPVTLPGGARDTALTSAWLQRACAPVIEYFDDHSGGKQNLEFTVFDWLPLTFQQWSELQEFRNGAVNGLLAAVRHVDLSGYQHFIYVVDDGDVRGGSTVVELQTSIIGARDVCPSLVAREVAILFGATGTSLERPEGPDANGDRFCVMGGDDSKFSFHDASLEDPGQGADAPHTRCGPGMCLPTLLATGWITLEQNGVQASGSVTGLTGSVATIRVLDGVTHTEGGIAVCCYLDDGDRYLVEYRSHHSKWDRGTPPLPLGWLLVHRTPLDGPLESLLVGQLPVTPGLAQTFGGPESLYLFGASPLRLTILGADAQAGTVQIQFARHKAEVPQYIDPDRQFRQELRYVLWSPESGLHVFPASSDLAKVLKGVADLKVLRSTLRASPRRYQAGLSTAFESQQKKVQHAVAEVSLRDESPEDRLLSRLERLKERLARHKDFAEFERDLETLESLARSIRQAAAMRP